ncbi:retropepsin-like aspartic protease family protein [Nitrosomonas supralitoralis]|uniref:Clan AA aspartic protease, TIGR02281 family n=1 Tax=Nitrosomonas supralitoralis TaxID=2116706 RepID=A0A2P7NU21_9PROT|nr:retropepsin-like aspartic protease [Nitrosomonas supralitoralis]PSJ16928.1 hypothetical protein C7H79_10820 [Nitrosomonas supralitoralis]
MGIQDRDYYYEKRNSDNDRGNRKPATKNLPDLSWKFFVRTILIWVLLGLVFLIIFDRYKSLQQSRSHAEINVDSRVLVPRNCEALPLHGSAYLFDPSMNRTDVLYAGLEIENKHDHPMVAILFDPASAKRLLALSITSGNSNQITVPIGQYGMQVLLGSNWCNLERGFSDGAIVTVAGGISVMVGSTTYMQFSGAGIRPVKLALGYSTLQPVTPQNLKQPSEVIGIGKLDLLQTRDGHYFSSGTVNGVPVVFMIDTGATIISVSTEIASQAGIQKCIPQQTTTANGNVNACKAIVPEVTFGKFKLSNVEVMVMPNMPGNALLGMNVLRNFHIEQINQVMRISSR